MWWRHTNMRVIFTGNRCFCNSEKNWKITWCNWFGNPITDLPKHNVATTWSCLNIVSMVPERTARRIQKLTHGIACGDSQKRGHTQIAKFVGPTWGPSGAGRTQMGPMLVPWTLLSGYKPLWGIFENAHLSLSYTFTPCQSQWRNTRL